MNKLHFGETWHRHKQPKSWSRLWASRFTVQQDDGFNRCKQPSTSVVRIAASKTINDKPVLTSALELSQDGVLPQWNTIPPTSSVRMSTISPPKSTFTTTLVPVVQSQSPPIKKIPEHVLVFGANPQQQLCCVCCASSDRPSSAPVVPYLQYTSSFVCPVTVFAPSSVRFWLR